MATTERTILLKLEVDEAGAIKDVKQFTGVIEKNTLAVKDNTEATEKDEKAQKEASKETKKATKTTKDYTGAVDSLNNSVGKLPEGFGGAIQGVKGLGKAFKALLANPVVAVLSLIVAALSTLLAAFGKTAEGGDFLDSIMGGITQTIDVLFGRVNKIREGIVSIFSGDIRKGLSELGGAFTGVGKEIEAAFISANKLVKLRREIIDSNTQLVVGESELTKQMELQRSILDDTDVSIGKRIESNNRLNELNLQLLRLREQNLELQAQEQNELLQNAVNRRQDTQEIISEIGNIVAAKNNAEAETFRIEKEFIVKRNELFNIQKTEAEERAEIQKAEDDAKRRIEIDELKSRGVEEVQIHQDIADGKLVIDREASKQAFKIYREELAAKRSLDKLVAKEKAELALGGARLAITLGQTLFGASKESAAATAVIDTALAILSASKLTPPANIPAMIFAAATGAIQLATIAGVQPPKTPTFASGGMMYGRLHSQGGINAELESGEAVLNRRSMSNPYLRELASQINQAGGGVKFADGGLVGISEAQNILNNTLSAVSNAPQVPVLVTEDLDAVQNRVAVTEAFSTL